MTRSKPRPRKFRFTIPETMPRSMPLQVWRTVCRTVLDENVPFSDALKIVGQRAHSQTKLRLVHKHCMDKQLWFDF